MTITLLAVVVVVAVVDWLAVVGRRETLESVAKPGVMLALIALAASGEWSPLLGFVIAALACSLIGDVLLLPSIDRFVAGLAAFLVAHVLYLAGFVAAGQTPALLLAGVVLTTIVTARIGRPILDAAAAEDRRLGQAVLSYLLALAAMAATAIGTGEVAIALGALIFVASDAVLGWNKFVDELGHGRITVHVLYHVGQTLIVLGTLST